jgi:hypothetical protein
MRAILRRRILLLPMLTVTAVATPSVPAATVAAGGPCTAGETRSVVFAFARAWSRGDTAAVERIVAPEPQHRWVSAGVPGLRAGSAAFNRRSLRAYIVRRHAQHDRLRLTSFKFNGSDLRGADGFGHFEFTAVRRADDWPDGLAHLRAGKGAIVCTLSRPMLAVWSLG